MKGTPPTLLTASQSPQHSDIEKPYFGEWYWDDISKNLGFTWYGPELYKGKTISQTFPAKTKWWSIFGGVTALYANGDTDQKYWELDYELVNKKAAAFPDYYDAHSNKWASDGFKRIGRLFQ